jgi:hypothetical protein
VRGFPRLSPRQSQAQSPGVVWEKLDPRQDFSDPILSDHNDRVRQGQALRACGANINAKKQVLGG